MYWIDTSSESHGSPIQTSFFCDTTSDIQNLPTSTAEGVKQGDDDISCRKCNKGSFCICIEDGSGWILNSQDIWTQV